MKKTAEAVSMSHPDKICDQISDAVLDACLKQDQNSRVAIETLGGHGMIVVCGELTTKAKIDIKKIAQTIYSSCGYNEAIKILVNVKSQSPEIAHGVDNEGAGDQGIMVGYATNETPEFLPLEVVLARKLAKAMGARDGKSQVTVDDGKVVSFITSVCGEKDDYKKVYKQIEKVVKKEIVPRLAKKTTLEKAWLKNPNGSWTLGGFIADTGLTGRKLAVDNYGPNIPLGGGCFSGKDATKVDRSAAYMARRIAVDYLKKHKAKEVFVHLAYAIGVAEPQMAVVAIDGRQEEIKGYDLRPRAIINKLELLKPQYRESAKYGHFGNSFIWDK